MLLLLGSRVLLRARLEVAGHRRLRLRAVPERRWRLLRVCFKNVIVLRLLRLILREILFLFKLEFGVGTELVIKRREGGRNSGGVVPVVMRG